MKRSENLRICNRRKLSERGNKRLEVEKEEEERMIKEEGERRGRRTKRI